MNTNGTAPQGAPVAWQPGEALERARHSREQLADSLRTLLADEERNYQALREAAEEARQRVDHLRKALDHLVAEPSRAAKAPAKTAPAKPQGTGTWEVSEERIAAVLAAYRQQTEPISPTVLAKTMNGIAGETVRRATERLRERELIRFAGTTRGGGKLYMPMPEVPMDEEAQARAAA
jgi:CRP-like cAMP-binding protein